MAEVKVESRQLTQGPCYHSRVLEFQLPEMLKQNSQVSPEQITLNLLRSTSLTASVDLELLVCPV